MESSILFNLLIQSWHKVTQLLEMSNWFLYNGYDYNIDSDAAADNSNVFDKLGIHADNIDDDDSDNVNDNNVNGNNDDIKWYWW